MPDTSVAGADPKEETVVFADGIRIRYARTLVMPATLLPANASVPSADSKLHFASLYG
jgi:hypothetical protein